MIVALVWYTTTTNAPLFCGGVVDHSQSWVAWDFAVNGGKCGDLILIETVDGRRVFPALDSGRFGHYCAIQLDGSCPPIAVDVPKHMTWFPGLSTLGTVRNLSEERRHEEARQ